MLMSFACNTVRAWRAYAEESIITTTLGYVLTGLAAAFLLRKLQVRLQLSAAKHRSLAGHSRMAGTSGRACFIKKTIMKMTILEKLGKRLQSLALVKNRYCQR